MTVQIKSLLTVKTLTKNYAKQIAVAKYQPGESLLSNIKLSIHPEIGDCTIGKVHGWVDCITLKEIGVKHVGLGKMWLVEYENQLFWIPAPDKGDLYCYYVGQGLPQLFI